MRSDEIRKEALSVYSHANVRDRYDADLMMAGFSDGVEWADAHPVAPEPQGEPSDAQVEAALIAHLGYDPAPAGFPFKDDEKDQMRAALRAAEEAKR